MIGRTVRAIPGQYLTLAAVIVLGVILVAVQTRGGFFSPVSVRTFFQYLAIPIVIGLAQMATLAVGQLNLAIGAIGGVAACTSALLMADAGLPAALGGVLAVLIGLAAGLANGLLVVATRINGFIVTLATMTILSGAQYAVVGTRTIKSSAWPALRAIGDAAPLGIPAVFWIAVVIAVLTALAYRHLPAFRRMLASGGNPLAATLSGISNDRAIVFAHALSGALAGVAALLALASLPGANQSVGGDWLLSSFAAPIIGGVALTGGAVAVVGTVLAATIVRLVDTSRAAFQLEPSVVNLVIGAVVLGTVAIERVRGRGRRGRRPGPPADAPPTAARVSQTRRSVDTGAAS